MKNTNHLTNNSPSSFSAEIRYGKVSEVAARFRDNKSSNSVHAPS
jgi:hypothetical protein